ncbi:hypothetical protein D3C72_454910 [compost metagenome]
MLGRVEASVQSSRKLGRRSKSWWKANQKPEEIKMKSARRGAVMSFSEVTRMPPISLRVPARPPLFSGRGTSGSLNMKSGRNISATRAVLK